VLSCVASDPNLGDTLSSSLKATASACGGLITAFTEVPCNHSRVQSANDLAERLNPGWTASKSPLCAFIRSASPFLTLPSVSSACTALTAGCPAELTPIITAISRVAAPTAAPSDILHLVSTLGLGSDAAAVLVAQLHSSVCAQLAAFSAPDRFTRHHLAFTLVRSLHQCCTLIGFFRLR
jgi:hypothetical protein